MVIKVACRRPLHLPSLACHSFMGLVIELLSLHSASPSAPKAGARGRPFQSPVHSDRSHWVSAVKGKPALMLMKFISLLSNLNVVTPALGPEPLKDRFFFEKSSIQI